MSDIHGFFAPGWSADGWTKHQSPVAQAGLDLSLYLKMTLNFDPPASTFQVLALLCLGAQHLFIFTVASFLGQKSPASFLLISVWLSHSEAIQRSVFQV